MPSRSFTACGALVPVGRDPCARPSNPAPIRRGWEAESEECGLSRRSILLIALWGSQVAITGLSKLCVCKADDYLGDAVSHGHIGGQSEFDAEALRSAVSPAH